MRTYYFLILLSVLAVSCSKSGNSSGGNTPTPIPTAPNVSTTAVTILTTTIATSGGNVGSDGGATVTARGVCWANHSNPQITDNHTSNGTGTGVFGSTMQGLNPGTVYFVRAYATNSVGITYGNAISFTTTPTLPPSGDYYTTGDLTFPGFGNSVPAIWKNGTPTAISGAINPAHAQSIFIPSTGDIYVSGYERNGTVNMARIWWNSVGTFLTNSFNSGGIGRSVYVTTGFNTDVYVAGESYNGSGTAMATLWKNGLATFLSAGTSSASAYSVFVSGGTNVYVAGNEGNVAKVWLNGSVILATNGANPAFVYCVTISFAASFPDWYGAGSEMIGTKTAAVIWKNGTPTYLTNGTFNAAANSVYVSTTLTSTDVYVAGYENNGTKNVAKVWKNGVPISLTDGTKDAMATSVHGSGADVYVGGYENDGTKNVAKLWKNGLEITLQNSANAGFITGVFVK